MAPVIRPAVPADLDSIYSIALRTGDSGLDATAHHQDGQLIGHIYAAPYVLLEPDLAFVAEDDKGVAGYVVGTRDTIEFERKLEQHWWPDLRRRYPDPTGIPPESWTADQQRIHAIHYPHRVPATVLAAFPAHMHMNLLPRLRGQGMGTKLFDRWTNAAQELGVKSVHVGVSPTNPKGQGFWASRGMQLQPTQDGVWLGKHLA